MAEVRGPIYIDSANLVIEFRADDEEGSDADVLEAAAHYLRGRSDVDEVVVAITLNSCPSNDEGDGVVTLRLVTVPVD